MKNPIILFALTLILVACETEVEPDISSSLNVLVIDAFLTSNDPVQHINITRSQSYFDSRAPQKVTGATVTLTDLTDSSIPVFTFPEQQDRYVWQSPDGSGLGIIGHQYELHVELDGNSFRAISLLKDAPPVDSISFRLEEGNAFFDDLIFAELFATDLVGLNDTYRIKTWKNGEFLGQPGQINIAYDAAFSPSPDNDGVQFIQPIRDAISPFEEARNGDFLSPFNLPFELALQDDTLRYKDDGSIYGLIKGDSIFYEIKSPVGEVILFENNRVPSYQRSLSTSDDRFYWISANELGVKGDSVYVEIHSISNETFFFMNQVIIETTREGGFGALFATPLANVSTNIIPSNPATPVAGFFNIATVSSLGTRLSNEDQVRVVQ